MSYLASPIVRLQLSDYPKRMGTKSVLVIFLSSPFLKRQPISNSKRGTPCRGDEAADHETQRALRNSCCVPHFKHPWLKLNMHFFFHVDTNCFGKYCDCRNYDHTLISCIKHPLGPGPPWPIHHGVHMISVETVRL